MYSPHNLMLSFLIALALFVLAIPIYYLLPRPDSKNKAPKPSGAWPIIGHLHLLRGLILPHISLGSMADKLGPTFMLRLGLRQALVVSDWEVAKELYTTNDHVLASRPSSIAVQLMGYNYAMFGFAPYGAYWRRLRKIVMLEVLSNSKLESLKNVRDFEISTSIKELYSAWEKSSGKAKAGPVKVDMKQWFNNLTLNLILGTVAGKRYCGETSSSDESRRWQNAMRDFMRLLGIFVVEDAIPWLGWLGLHGYKKEMKNTFKELDSIIQGWVEDHQKKKLSGEAEGEDDFIYTMMSTLEDAKITDYDADTITKATVLTLISGGSYATFVTLTWAMSLLLNNPQAMKEAQKELDIHVGKDRKVDESDLKNLVYLQAIAKETMRLYPAAPLSGPRVATEECTIAGYNISKGTQLIVNLWKLQRDPSVWSDPHDFRPERFMVSNVDVRGQHFQLIPFGSGRRACPGISLALQVMQLSLARLLHQFDLTTELDCTIDMTESIGQLNVKDTPLEVFISPRLPSLLYAC